METYKSSPNEKNEEVFIVSLGYANKSEFFALAKEVKNAQKNVYDNYEGFKDLPTTDKDNTFNDAFVVALGSPAFGTGIRSCIRKYQRAMMAELDDSMSDAEAESIYTAYHASIMKNCFRR